MKPALVSPFFHRASWRGAGGGGGLVAECLLPFPGSLLRLLAPPISKECTLVRQLTFFQKYLVIEIYLAVIPMSIYVYFLCCLESLLGISRPHRNY